MMCASRSRKPSPVIQQCSNSTAPPASLSPGNRPEGTLTFTPVSLPADVKSLCAEMLINFSYVNGGSWQIGEQKETPFPARQPAQPHLFQGNADPPLIGYYLANEPLWEEISDAVAALDGSNPRKRRLAAMLEEKHKTIKALNRARETSLGSFADLAARGLPVKSRSAKEDMQTFTAIFLEGLLPIGDGGLPQIRSRSPAHRQPVPARDDKPSRRVLAERPIHGCGFLQFFHLMDMRQSCRWLCLLALIPALEAMGAAPDGSETQVLLEAEQFADCGGWDLDQQSMDVMGSPYLLAHGLGVPVKDAVTTAKFRSPGCYRVWARTRDWVAPWKAPGAPGRFQVLVNGRPLAETFGTSGEDWHWQDGGSVEIGREAKIALHDLTGFEGRCDAVLFSQAHEFHAAERAVRAGKVPPGRARTARGTGRWRGV